METHNNQSTKNDHSHNHSHYQRHNTTIDLYPIALRAIEEDDLDKMKTVIELESFNKDSIDTLLEKACERSHDITLKEKLVRNFANMTHGEEQSMLSVCQTSRKNNEELVNLLLQAETQAELVDNQKSEASNNKDNSPLSTPTKPILKSVEKDPKFMTPETPKFKSNVRRELKFS